MIYFGPGPSWIEIVAVLGFAIVVFGFVVRNIIKSEEKKQGKK